MYRWDIINHLIKKNDYKSYLEIGYYKGWSFDRIECEKKTAVDPHPCKTPFQENLKSWSWMCLESTPNPSDEFPEAYIPISDIYIATSDRYFEYLSNTEPEKKYDLIFIDGLHESQQVDRDIQNAFKHLNQGGTIVMHDCNPSTEEMTLGGTANGEWTGDVYKSAIEMKFDFGDGDFYVVDTDYGVGVLKPTKTLPWKPKWVGKWEDFDKNREFLLNLISPEEFLKREPINQTENV